MSLFIYLCIYLLALFISFSVTVHLFNVFQTHKTQYFFSECLRACVCVFFKLNLRVPLSADAQIYNV